MGFSFWHVLLLTIIVLVIFGPSRLPGLGRSIGEAIKGFKEGMDGKDGSKDVTTSAKNEIEEGKSDKDSSKKS